MRPAASGSGATKLQALTSLQEVDLQHNELTGHLPSWLGKAGTNLVKFDASHNKIEGTLPDEWKRAVNLVDIDLAHVRESATEDAARAIFTAVEIPCSPQNELTGMIPVTWFPLNSTEQCSDGWGLHKLTHLEVFTGSLPPRCFSIHRSLCQLLMGWFWHAGEIQQTCGPGTKRATMCELDHTRHLSQPL